MSVETGYTGGFGNNLFQYSVARLFAYYNNLEFKTRFHKEFEDTKPQTGRSFSSPAICVDEHNIDNIWDNPAIDAYYTFSGFFQQSHRYNKNRELIKTFFKFRPPAKNPNDIVIHLRQDDYGLAHRIHWSWYLDILNNEKFDKLYIVSLNPHQHQKYIANFNKWSPIIISNDYLSDFSFISSFDKIICANSTFSWWAAFLGNPSRVYTFKPWLPANVGSITLYEMPNATPVDGKFMA